MRLWEVIIVSVGLSLDAVTIAVCRESTGKFEKINGNISWDNIWSNSNNYVSGWNDYCIIPYVKYK